MQPFGVTLRQRIFMFKTPDSLNDQQNHIRRAIGNYTNHLHQTFVDWGYMHPRWSLTIESEQIIENAVCFPKRRR